MAREEQGIACSWGDQDTMRSESKAIVILLPGNPETDSERSSALKRKFLLWDPA